MARHDHPIFTRVYSLIVRFEDSGSVGQARQDVCAPLAGRILIVGLGPGMDLGHLPDSVTEVVAIEPSPSMRRAAQPAVSMARETGLKVTVHDGVAEVLQFDDDSFDGVLFAYVLCSVNDPKAAVDEARRVLRPDGVVAVLEHVKAAPGTFSAHTQRIVRRIWPRFAGGCHCDRDTKNVFEAAGFDVSRLSDDVLVNLPPVAPVIMGVTIPRSLR